MYIWSAMGSNRIHFIAAATPDSAEPQLVGGRVKTEAAHRVCVLAH